MDLDGATLTVRGTIYAINVRVRREARENCARCTRKRLCGHCRASTLPAWTLGVPKTGLRTLDLPASAVAALREQRRFVDALLAQGRVTAEAAAFVFPSRGGRKYPFITLQRVYQRWRYLLTGERPGRGTRKRGGLPVRYIGPYGLRHTHATALLEAGASMREVAENLGHRDIKTLHEHYGHVKPLTKRRRGQLLDRLFLGREDPGDIAAD